MSHNFVTTLSLVVLWFPGFLLANLILGNRRSAEALGLGFLIGSQVHTFVLFVINYYLGISLDLSLGWVVYGTLTFILFILNILLFSHRSLPRMLVSPSLTLPQKTVTGLFLIILIVNFVASLWYPVSDWDAVTLYDYRAKIILDTGQVSSTLLRANLVEYPLYTTLLHWWGYINHSNTAMPIYQFIFAAFIVSIYSLLRRQFGVTFSALVTLSIIASPKIFEQSYTAYTNMPYTVFLVLSMIYLYYWSVTRHSSDLIMGILLSIFSLWVRGFPFFLVNLTLVGFTHFRPYAPPKYYKKFFAFTLLIVAVLYFTNVSLLFKVIDFIYWSVIKYYFPYPLVFLLVVLFLLKHKSANWFLSLAVAGYYLSFLIGNYYYALHNPNFAILPDAIQRTVMFVNPVIVLCAIYAFKDTLRPYNEK